MAAQKAGAMEIRICDRLSKKPGLRLPGSVTQGDQDVSQEAKRVYLSGLLSRDPSVFLERYGEELEDDELETFLRFSDDYEVSFYLQRLHSHRSAKGQKDRNVLVKNRRLAQMNRLVEGGEYFSEESMRSRAPLLYQQYIGQYTGDGTRPKSREQPSTLWESLLDNIDEVDVQQRLQEEVDFEEQAIEESEEDDDDPCEPSGDAEMTEASERNGNSVDCAVEKEGSLEQSPAQQTSKEEQELLRGEFVQVMKERFLQGEDGEYVNYKEIDRDASLDDDWHEQRGRDLEEKYFEQD